MALGYETLVDFMLIAPTEILSMPVSVGRVSYRLRMVALYTTLKSTEDRVLLRTK